MSGLLEFTSIFEILCLAFWQVWWTNELVADTWLYVWCDMWLAIGTDRSKSSMLTIFSMFKVSSFWCHFWLAMAKCLCLSWPVGFESVCNHTLRFWAGPNSVQLYTMTRVSMGIWPQFDGGCEGYLYIYIIYIQLFMMIPYQEIMILLIFILRQPWPRCWNCGCRKNRLVEGRIH